MSLAQWSFTDAEALPTADRRYTFYRVRGERATKQDMYGMSMTVDITGLWPASPVEGEGATPEEALAEAMRKARQEDERACDMLRNVQTAIMGGRNFR